VKEIDLLSNRESYFTCGPSRTEAEHPQPRFGEVNDTRWGQEGEVSARSCVVKEGIFNTLVGFWLNDSAFRPFFGVRAICLKP
jgi:hypothetical protein